WQTPTLLPRRYKIVRRIVQRDPKDLTQRPQYRGIDGLHSRLRAMLTECNSDGRVIQQVVPGGAPPEACRTLEKWRQQCLTHLPGEGLRRRCVGIRAHLQRDLVEEG